MCVVCILLFVCLFVVVCVAPSSADLADFDMKLKQLLNMGISEVCV